MPEVKQLDFLNPASTLTPGIAGGLTTTVAMALATQFDMKFNWVALSVSLLLGAVVAFSYPQKIAFMLRTVYMVLNALVIFSFSVGAGRTLDSPPAPPVAPVAPMAATVSHLDRSSGRTVDSVRDVLLALISPPVASADPSNELKVQPMAMSPSAVTNDPKTVAALQEELRRVQAEKNAAMEKARQEQELRKAEREALLKQQSQLKAYQQKLNQYDKDRAQYEKRWSW